MARIVDADGAVLAAYDLLAKRRWWTRLWAKIHPRTIEAPEGHFIEIEAHNLLFG